MDRVFIVGNGGCGKTWFADKLAGRVGSPVTHLDQLHWLPDLAGERPRDERDRLVREAADGDRWIMEGIYGSILRDVLPRVTDLIWLDIPEEECVSNLLARGQQGGGSEAQFRDLLDYTRGYCVRQNLNSFEGHRRLFDEHASRKSRLTSRAEMAALLAEIT